MKLYQEGRDVVSLFLSESKACTVVLDVLESLDRGFIDTREKRIAVVNARHKTEDEFGGSFGKHTPIRTLDKTYPRHIFG